MIHLITPGAGNIFTQLVEEKRPFAAAGVCHILVTAIEVPIFHGVSQALLILRPSTLDSWHSNGQ